MDTGYDLVSRLKTECMAVVDEAARVILGLASARDLQAAATRALAAGCMCPSLPALAAATVITDEEAHLLFGQILSELDIPAPAKPQAALLLAWAAAEAIEMGAIPPYQGAKAIWQLSSRAGGDFHELDEFVYAASEWEDRLSERAHFDSEIVDAARRLLLTRPRDP